MKLRVDELAARSGVSVDTVRFYQSRGLLPPPEREGRVAWYSVEHVARIERVRDLKDKGLTLAAIKRLLAGELGAPDEALVHALVSPPPGGDAGGALLTVDELARRTGVSPALLEAVEREGLLVPRTRAGERLYTEADAAAIAAGVSLLEAGLPLGELLALARKHDEAMRAIADLAVDLFVRFVRDPIRDSSSSDVDAAERLIDAFTRMLPATTELVTHHFRRVLLLAAEERAAREGIVLTEEATVPSSSERQRT